MKKQFIILLAVVASLLAALCLAACSQPAASSASASADSSAEASAAASSAEEAAESADAAASDVASADAAAEASTETAAATAEESEFKGIPTEIPADHEGRTVDQCPTCHTTGAGGAAAIPADHFVDGDTTGELDGARNQCGTCHLPAAA